MKFIIVLKQVFQLFAINSIVVGNINFLGGVYMKHIVITGSTRGIGRGLAEQFLLRGHKVTINGTSSTSVQNALKTLGEKYRGRVQGVIGNVNHYEDIDELYKKAVEGFGPVDIWINNAGIDQQWEMFIDCDINQCYKVIDTNIKGVINGTQVAMKHMNQQGYGFIYNMEGYGSDGRTMHKMSIYGTSKRAVSYFTQSIAKEVKGTNIKIGRLSPGMVMTDLIKNGIPKDEVEMANFKKICNILADTVEDVTDFLAERILANHKNNVHIKWLTSRKVVFRFLTSKFSKRNVWK